MQTLENTRDCATCVSPMPIVDNKQVGWLCCDAYYCSQKCLDESFKDEPKWHGGWESHFTDDGDCYYTEWELEYEQN